MATRNSKWLDLSLKSCQKNHSSKNTNSSSRNKDISNRIKFSSKLDCITSTILSSSYSQESNFKVFFIYCITFENKSQVIIYGVVFLPCKRRNYEGLMQFNTVKADCFCLLFQPQCHTQIIVSPHARVQNSSLHTPLKRFIT